MRYYLLYDGDCRFCRAFKGMVVLLDSRGTFVPVGLASSEAELLLGGMSAQQMRSSFHIVTPTRQAYSGGEALPRLLSSLLESGLVSWLVETSAVRALLSAGYASLSKLVSVSRCGSH